MTVPEYFEVVKAHLLTNPLVENFQIVRERIAANDGHIRVRMKLINSNLIEFSEYIQLYAGNIQVITYSYHCTDTFGKLIVRWDNTPHFPDLDNFPHHKHIGYPETVESGYPMNIFRVLDEITQSLKYQHSLAVAETIAAKDKLNKQMRDDLAELRGLVEKMNQE